MGKTAFVFPGQGSQYVGMGQELAAVFPAAAAVLADAEAALGFPLRELCFHGPESDLNQTENTQPAVLAVSIACLKVLESSGVAAPALVAGHSLGEYTALVAAGSLDLLTALELVRRRGRLMAEAAPPGSGGMMAILGLEREQVEEVCRLASGPETVVPANYNCPGQVVVAGHNTALDRADALARQAGAKRTVRLKVSGPFHSPLMRPAAEGLAAALAAVTVRDPVVPLVANISGDYVQTSVGVRKALVSQVCGAVRWEDSILRMIEAGVTTFVEIGPGRVLSGLIRKTAPAVRVMHVEDRNSLENTLAYLRESV